MRDVTPKYLFLIDCYSFMASSEKKNALHANRTLEVSDIEQQYITS